MEDQAGIHLVARFVERVGSEVPWDTSRSGEHQASELQETDDPNGRTPDNR